MPTNPAGNPYGWAESNPTKAQVSGGEMNLLSSAGTEVDPATEQSLEQLLAALNSEGNDELRITQTQALRVVEDAALDVSASTVSVQEDTPLDVSASTVTVTEGAPMDVSAAPVDISGDMTRDIGTARVYDSNGVLVDPATSDYDAPAGSADVAANGDAVISPSVPDRADTVTIFASGAAAFDVQVGFGDGNGTYVGRTYSSSSGEVFERAAVAADDLQITITDTSGNANNTVDYRIMVV